MSMRYPGGLIAPNPVNQQFPSGVWTGPQSAPYQANNVWGNDPSFRNTSLLLQAQGPAAPFIKDSSVNNFNITINGDTRSDSRTPFAGNGYYSNYFDGSGDTLNTASNAAFGFGSGAWTLEAWVYPTVAQTDNWIIATNDAGKLRMRVGASGYLSFYTDTGSISLNSTTVVTVNAWSHVAICYDGTTLSLFQNGTRTATSTVSISNGSANACYIGSNTVGGGYWNGYISNARVVKGSAVYSGATYTVPTTPLTAISGTSLLTCQSNSFIDNSSNAFAITVSGNTAVNALQPFATPSGIATYGSGYFDGSGDSLTSSNNSAFNLGSNNFTVEAWVYVTATPGGSGAVIIGKNSATYPGGYEFNFVVDTGRTIFFGAYTTTLVSLQGAIVTSLNSWNHVAAVRSGSNWALFVNGVRDVTATSSGTVQTTSSSLYVGDYGGGSRNLTGYISNVRLVNGSAVYDPTVSTLTIPTSPLAGIANTSLLTLQSNVPVNNNVFFDSSPNNYAITRTGSITQGSFTPYNAGYYSNYFDGSGDYLTAPASSAYAFGTSALTIEMWVYMTAYPASYSVLVSNRPYNSGNTTSWFTGLFSTGVFRFSDSLGSVNIDSPAGAVPLNAWTHLAAVRTSTGTNGVSLYINGVVVAQGTCNLNFSTTTNGLVMGTSYDPSNYYITGFVSNLRIVNGTAVYTSAFTPSTTPLTAIANTVFLTCQSNRLIDNSTNNFTITKVGDVNVQAFDPFPPSLQYTTSSFSGSGYFFGASNSLATPSGTCPVINDFSASGWVYRTSVPGYQQTFIAMGLDGPGRVGFFWTGSNFEYNIYGSSTVTIDGSGSMPVGAWTYVVLTRTGSSLSLYYNGTLKATVSLGTAFSAASGRAMSWMDGTIGYATNLRFDTAAYSSPTTVPTAPVSYTANTNNLLNFTNTGIFDNTMQNALVTEGDAKLNTSVVKYGTGSMYFDGTGDTLTIPGTPNLFIGTGNFTAEGWIYPTSVASARAIISFANNNVFYLNTSAIPYYGIYTVSDTALGSTPVALNTWTHIAFVRNGTTLTCYLNGVSVGSTTTSSSIGDTTTSSYVGSHRSSNYWLGYIDDLRITKGVARYVTNFTPPVARMPNQ